MITGKILVYYGFGKGKSSALAGGVLRSLGWGKKVAYFQFLKNRPSGEILMLDKFKNVTFTSFYNSSTKFFWEMNANEKSTLYNECNDGWSKITEALKNSDYDLIVIDELLGCLHNKLLKINDIVKSLKEKKPNINVIISGQICSKELIEIADLVTEFKVIKHYFNEKINAIQGLEY